MPNEGLKFFVGYIGLFFGYVIYDKHSKNMELLGCSSFYELLKKKDFIIEPKNIRAMKLYNSFIGNCKSIKIKDITEPHSFIFEKSVIFADSLGFRGRYIDTIEYQNSHLYSLPYRTVTNFIFDGVLDKLKFKDIEPRVVYGSTRPTLKILNYDLEECPDEFDGLLYKFYSITLNNNNLTRVPFSSSLYSIYSRCEMFDLGDNKITSLTPLFDIFSSKKYDEKGNSYLSDRRVRDPNEYCDEYGYEDIPNSIKMIVIKNNPVCDHVSENIDKYNKAQKKISDECKIFHKKYDKEKSINDDYQAQSGRYTRCSYMDSQPDIDCKIIRERYSIPIDEYCDTLRYSYENGIVTIKNM